MNEQASYQRQMRMSLMAFLIELPNFIAMAVSAVVSSSVLVWTDLMDSLGNVLGTGIVALLSRKLSRNLKYEYNYGIGKLEAMTALISEGIGLFGLSVVAGASVVELFDIKQPSGMLIYVVLIKLVNITFDIIFVREQWKIKKLHESKVTKSQFMAQVSALCFDLAAGVSLLVVWALRNNPLSWYLSPTLAVLIAAYLFVGGVKRIRSALNELSDKTLPEEEQLKILTVLAKYHDAYLDFHGVKSHYYGDFVCIDLCISFQKEKTYGEIAGFLSDIRSDIEKTIENSRVAIIIE